MPPGDASVVTQLLGSNMNRLAGNEFPPRQATRSCSMLSMLLGARVIATFGNLLVYIVCDDLCCNLNVVGCMISFGPMVHGWSWDYEKSWKRATRNLVLATNCYLIVAIFYAFLFMDCGWIRSSCMVRRGEGRVEIFRIKAKLGSFPEFDMSPGGAWVIARR